MQSYATKGILKMVARLIENGADPKDVLIVFPSMSLYNNCCQNGKHNIAKELKDENKDYTVMVELANVRHTNIWAVNRATNTGFKERIFVEFLEPSEINQP